MKEWLTHQQFSRVSHSFTASTARSSLVRSFIMSLRHLTYSLLLLLVAIDACRNPLDGVTLGLKDPIQDGVVECRFYDPAGNPIPTDNQIQMAGPDGEQVVTTVNTKKYKINSDGDLLVAAAPGTTFSPQKPFRFTLVVEAENYLTVVQPFALTSADKQTRSIRRINLLKSPPAITAARTAGNAGSDGVVTAQFSLTTANQNSSTDVATVTFQPGTKLVDRAGAAVGGNLTLQVIHTNTRSGEANNYIPGEGIMTSVAGRDGGPSLGTVRLLSIAGSVTIQLYNEQYALATNLSSGVRWTMDLSPSAYNILTRRAIQEGDSIPLFRYDDYTYRWQEEKPGVVKRNPQTGRLTYQATALHTGAYVVGWTESICSVGPVFKVSSQLANVDVNYLCKLIDVTTGKQVSAFYANTNNGATIPIYNQSKNRKLKLQVFDQTDAWGTGTKGGLIAESGPGTTCDQTPVAINLASLPVPPVMKLAFEYTCPGGKMLDQSSLPALIKTQYSEAGQNDWHDLITVTRTQRKTASYRLKVGRYYDFRASTDGGATWPLHQDNYLVDKPEWTLKIRAEMYCK